MSFFTLAYAVRLGVWGLGAALLQGVLIWASWTVWDRATANAAARLRHRIVCAHFAALAVIPILTMLILHFAIGAVALSPESPVRMLPPLAPGFGKPLQLALPLSFLWLAGAGVMVFRLTRDARRITCLPRKPAPPILTEAVRRLGRGWTGARIPEICISDVASPQIVGLWRPTLFAPHDLVSRFPPAEREAVLLHELAHMRRRDFGWNLLQRLVLTFLWFSPAAWSLYRHVCREREACCDALAVEHGARPAALARALVRLAEPDAHLDLAMAAANEGALSARIGRLIGPKCPGSTSLALQAGALTLPVLCLLTLGGGSLGLADAPLRGFYNASAFGPTISIDAIDPAGPFALRIKQGQVVAASIGERPLPPGRIVQRGGQVTLLGRSREPILAVTVAPQGTISWEARRGKTPAD